jgi:heat shock protein HslJ
MRYMPLLFALTILLPVFIPAHGTDEPTLSNEPAPEITAQDGLQQTLEEYRWALIAATDSENRRIDALFPAAGRSYTFTFSASMLSIQGGCNTSGGGYQINAQGEFEPGQMRSTMMACAPELMQADTALAALLAKPLHIEVTEDAPPQLLLRTASNETLTLQGQATPEALYGPGTLIFLEVDDKQLPCRNPRNGQTTCLQVREISFDEQGLRTTTPGPWRPFYDNIDGYNHTSGERTVLRVKRFDRGAVADTAAPALYVLDLIIETAIVPSDSQ